MKKGLRKAELRGDCTRLIGNCSGLRGDVSGLRGGVSELRGDLDECEILEEDRQRGVNIHDLIGE